LQPQALGDDSRKASYLLSHFRGPALDWVARYMQTPAARSDSFAQLVGRVKDLYGYDPAQQMAMAQTRLGVMTQTGDLMEFLVEFDSTTAAAGVNSDTSKIAFLMPKLKHHYREQVLAGGDLIQTYSTVRNRLGNVYSREGEAKKPADVQRKTKQCKVCGKKGHTGTQCRTKN